MPSLIRKNRAFLSLACVILATIVALPAAKAISITIDGNTVPWTSGIVDYDVMAINGGGSFFLADTGIVSATHYRVGDTSAGSLQITGGVATGSFLEINRNGTTLVTGGLLQLATSLTVYTGVLAVNSGTVRAPIMNVGSYLTRGIVDQRGGVVEVSSSVSIGNASSASSYGISGGLLSTPTVSLGAGSSYAELFVNGGTVSTGQITRTPTGSAILTLGGGRIIATGSNASFIPASVTIQLLDGASTVFDTNGKTIGIQSNMRRHADLTTTDGGITVTGGGTLTLTATNTYTGQTQVQGATTLRLSGATSLRESTLNLTSGTVQFVNHTSGTFGGLAGTQGFALANDLGQAYTLNVGRNHENTSFSGVLSGSGSLVKSGTGALTLTGNSTYTGGTTVNTGTLELGGADSNTGRIRGSLTINAGATVRTTGVNALGWEPGYNVNSVTINSGTFLSPAGVDQGWGVAYTLDGGYMATNGGTTSTTSLSKFSFGNFTTVSVTGAKQSTIAGHINLRSDLNPNTDFTVGSGATLLVTAGISSSAASFATGTAGFTKKGGGTMILTGSNSYNGGTLVNGGTLTARNDSAMGTGAVTVNAGGVFVVDTGFTVGNEIVLTGGQYRKNLTGSLAHAVDATSDLGGMDTSASLLAGTTVGTTLITSFSSTSAASNDNFRRSDVYHFAGTDDAAFALELSFTSTEEGLYLGWLSGGQWTNAVDGNSGNNASGLMLNFQGSFEDFQLLYGTDLSTYIGAYGVDVEGGVVSAWAVLDHNSDFTVIPEPSTAGLLAFGALTVLLRRWRVQDKIARRLEP
jgi:fibronectin-binding autotransporter adhesin